MEPDEARDHSLSKGSYALARLQVSAMNVVIASIVLSAAYFALVSDTTAQQARQRGIGAPVLRSSPKLSRPPRIVRIRPHRRRVGEPRTLQPHEEEQLRRTEDFIRQQRFPDAICKGC